MPHIHKLYDFVVSVFIVNRSRVLLVYHKKYKEWLPIGGHVDLDEDPEQALFKEIREECGLKVRILAPRPKIAHRGVKPIYTPSYVDVHRITDTHKHIAFVYFGSTQSDRVRLHEREHREYRWVSERGLSSKEMALTRSIRFYCRQALKRASLLTLCAMMLLAMPARAEAEYWHVLEVAKDGSTDIALDPSWDNALHLDAVSRQAFIKDSALKWRHLRGELFVLREKAGHAVTVSTPRASVELDQAAAAIETGAKGDLIRVFSESVTIQTKRSSQKAYSLSEGWKQRLSAAGEPQAPERMGFDDYADWQRWFKKNYERKDKHLPERHG